MDDADDAPRPMASEPTTGRPALTAVTTPVVALLLDGA